MSFMKIDHRLETVDSRERCPSSIDLMVTSPPYPMIEMWDHLWESNPEESPERSFEEGHQLIRDVMERSIPSMHEGSIVCINIGDATRTIDSYQMWDNRSKIVQTMRDLGFDQLPGILWLKPTNSPIKYMGSGMRPPNAYVTLEHEHILIFRRSDRHPDDQRRDESAFTWNQRNRWFSDTWRLPGRRGSSDDGSFPLEIPMRLIQMFSVYEDTIYDPFAGTGTTVHAAAACGRRGIGHDIDSFDLSFRQRVMTAARDRIQDFIDSSEGDIISDCGLPVKSSDSEHMILWHPNEIDGTTVEYEKRWIDSKREEINQHSISEFQ